MDTQREPAHVMLTKFAVRLGDLFQRVHLTQLNVERRVADQWLLVP
jgi:hypothetical protein